MTTGERLRIPADPALWPAKFTAPQPSSPSAPAPAPAQEATTPGSPTQAPASPGSGTSSATGGTSSFEQCVAWRESSNFPTEPDGLFGILPSTWASLGYSGTVGQASVAQQKAAFNRLYARDGAQPWAPYDGC